MASDFQSSSPEYSTNNLGALKMLSAASNSAASQAMPRMIENDPSPKPQLLTESNMSKLYLETPEDHLRRLQMTLEKNGLIPQSSNHCEDDNGIDKDLYEENDFKTPKMNSQKRVKSFRCKQCNFLATTKCEYWEHNKSHMSPDKILKCPKCPFITEYKHHLEYHLRNHAGSKPFKCEKCSYRCVNKSMLNSHLKSHSGVYQYSCASCRYVTKYIHSLKLHLRKKNHIPAMVLNPDGTPNPQAMIDIYGSKRGPKQKLQPSQEVQYNIPNPASLMVPNPPQFPMAFPFPMFPAPRLVDAAAASQMLIHCLHQYNKEIRFEQREPENEECSSQSSSSYEQSETPEDHDEVLDLSTNSHNKPQLNRRKGKAVKLEQMTVDGSSDEEDKTETPTNTDESKSNYCSYCAIKFEDSLLYSIHMDFHSSNNPFTCKKCRVVCENRVSFYMHLATQQH